MFGGIKRPRTENFLRLAIDFTATLLYYTKIRTICDLIYCYLQTWNRTGQSCTINEGTQSIFECFKVHFLCGICKARRLRRHIGWFSTYAPEFAKGPYYRETRNSFPLLVSIFVNTIHLRPHVSFDQNGAEENIVQAKGPDASRPSKSYREERHESRRFAARPVRRRSFRRGDSSRYRFAAP